MNPTPGHTRGPEAPLEQLMVQRASELLAETKMIMNHLGQTDLCSRVQQVKDELNLRVMQSMEDFLCT